MENFALYAKFFMWRGFAALEKQSIFGEFRCWERETVVDKKEDIGYWMSDGRRESPMLDGGKKTVGRQWSVVRCIKTKKKMSDADAGYWMADKKERCSMADA